MSPSAITLAVARLHEAARAVAAEHSHELGAWYSTDGLITAARCERCTATVALRAEGHGSNAEPLRWLSAPCGGATGDGPRYRVVKRSRPSPMVYAVVDTDRPELGAVAMRRKKAAAQAIADDRNGVIEAPAPDEGARLRARVDRLRAQLARAEAAARAAGIDLTNPTNNPTPEVAFMPAPKSRTPKTTTATRPKAKAKTTATPKAKAPTKPRAQTTTTATTTATDDRLPSGPEMAAAFLAREGRPVHMKLIAAAVLEEDRARPKAKRAYHGKTPDQTLAAQLTISHVKGGRFVRVAPATFGLRAWPKSKLGRKPLRPDGMKAPKAAAAAAAPKPKANAPVGVDPLVAAHSTIVAAGA